MGCESCKQARNDTDLDLAEREGEVAQDGMSRESSQDIASGRISALPVAPKAVSAVGNTAPGKALGADIGESTEFMAKVPLIRRLPDEIKPKVAAAFQKFTWRQGDTIIKQGDTGRDLLIVLKGEASVDNNGSNVANLKAGDFVGESALLKDEPRNATIIVKSQNLTALRLTRDDFNALGLKEKLANDTSKVDKAPATNRRAVGGGADSKVKTKPPSPKDAEERALMIEALKNNKNLQVTVTMDDAKCNKMIDIAWKETVSAGTETIVEGSLDADYFYIVQEGSFEFILSKLGSVGKVEKGGSFGELALLYLAPRAATVRALEDSIVWVMDRKNFKEILAKSDEGQVHEYVKYLNKVDIFSSLKDEEKTTIAKALHDMKFQQGEKILEQGERGDTFYILVEGEVSVIVDGKKVAKLTGTTGKAEIFGERAILSNEPRAATIKVQSDTARTLTMDKTSFEMLLGPLEALKNRGKGGSTATDSKAGSTNKASPADEKSEHILRKHLTKLGLLGCGGFGAVVLVEHVKTKETYAMKALSKGYIVKCGMQKAVMSEKHIQYQCNSPFIVKLYDTYNGAKTLYFLLELALGGELYATYNKRGFHGSEKHAKFYVAGTVFAFEHLHSLKIIYRDLKPENLLLNEEGQVKLTDMGLAKVVVGKTYTTCGTPDYFAPEVIKGTGHTHAVDWWALGILTYELLAGQPPFQAASPMATYKLIQEGIKKVQFSTSVGGDCAALVKSLCEKDPAERLAMRKDGAANIKKHKWYKSFDWEKMEKCQLPAPYKPHVKGKTDAANFSARKEDMPPSVDYVDDNSGWDKDFATST